MYRPTLAVLAATGLALAGCSGVGADSPAAPQTGSPSSATITPAGPLTVTDAWAKAQPDAAKTPMTGVFGTITNTTDTAVTITSATSDRSPVTELHETAGQGGSAAMQKVDGGFVIEPGATRELRPGGDHVMLMRMTEPLKPGETVTISLTTQDGATVRFQAVAKTYTGGDEKYHSDSPTPGTSSSPTGSPGAPSTTGTPTDSSS